MKDVRDTFVRTLITLAASDHRIVAVVNDSVSSSRLGPFRERYPKRFFNVGIAEQNQVGFAAGLAAADLVPWACSATCFLSYRALEQIKDDVVYAGQNVKLVGNTSGVDYGPLGSTHHSLEDVSILRNWPELALVIPADHEETAEAVQLLQDLDGPAYLRLYRTEVPESLGMPGQFRLGQIRILREGGDGTIFATGAMVCRALDAGRNLEEEGLQLAVVNVSSVSPFDIDGVVDVASRGGFVVTVEEHSVSGALGGAICEALAERHPMPVHRMGFPKGISPPGPADTLRERNHLTPHGIRKAALDLARRVL